MPRLILALLLVLAAGLMSGCGGQPAGVTLNVFAAASLTESFTKIAAEFEAGHPGVNVALNFAGSQALRTQIEQGAPADVFASANIDHMAALRRAGLVAEPVIFTQNRLVVILPASNPGGVQSLAGLARPGLKLLLADASVPVGRYARTALENLNHDPALPPDFLARVLANVVSEENNVKNVVAKVQLGEADAGLVYVSDVTAAVRNHLITLEIPPEYNVLAEYPLAITTSSRHSAAAQQFAAYVLSDRGQTLLAANGFNPTDLTAIGREP